MLCDMMHKGFAQPAVNPGLVEEIGNFVVMPGQRKSRTVQQVIFVGG